MIQAARLALITACALASGGAASAQGFTPPEGCTTYLTVHSMGCRISNHYTCEHTPGHRWRVDYRAEGATFMSHIDAEAQWVESRSLTSPDGSTTLFPARDPSSVTTLLETGVDDYDFEQRKADGRVVRVTGVDRLTGESVEIDGEPLLRISFSYRITDTASGELVDGGDGREFVSAVHRRFFSGISIYQTAEGEVQEDLTPLRFVYPGEPGFGATVPTLDCGMVISGISGSRTRS